MGRRSATVVTVALLGVAACSGSDERPSAAPASTDASATDETPAEPDVDPSDAAFCDAIEAIRSADFELEETFGDEARALFADVSSAAPPAISGEVETVVDTLDAIAELGISEDESDPEAVEAAFEILLDPAYTEANETLVAYTSTTCGIDLDDGDELGELDDPDGAVGIDGDA